MDQGCLIAGYGSIHDPIDVSGNDIEVRDILRRRLLAQRIVKRLEEADCPNVMGVYGGWGTGKTSLLNMLIHYNGGLNGQGLRILNIDAWKYESSDGLLIPLIIRFKELTGSAELPEVWKVIAKRTVATAGIVFADGILSPFRVGPSQIAEVYDKLSARDDLTSYKNILEKWEREVDEIGETEKAFKKLVDAAVQAQGGRRILICVDNLDRCSPENLVKLLESIKVFFNAPGCTWLFAMDSDVVAGYIAGRYRESGVDGYSYLDKIIPEQYHLSLSPALDQDVISTLLRYASGGGSYQIDPAKIPQIPKILVPRRLIKSARKFAEFYKGSFASRGVPPETVMALCLLYHTWPDFYQRLSSASGEHVRRILGNFFQRDGKDSAAAVLSKANIPLQKGFLQDSELIYFIQTAFPNVVSEFPEKHIRDIVNGMEGLREGGLP